MTDFACSRRSTAPTPRRTPSEERVRSSKLDRYGHRASLSGSLGLRAPRAISEPADGVQAA
jgi:hypothetical protein